MRVCEVSGRRDVRQDEGGEGQRRASNSSD